MDEFLATGKWPDDPDAPGAPSVEQHEKDLADMRAQMKMRADGPRPVAAPQPGAVLVAVGSNSDPDELMRAGGQVAPPDPDAARAMLMRLDSNHDI